MPHLRSLRSPLLAGLLSLACVSSQGPPEMTDEQKLDLYRETAFGHYENEDLGRAESQALKGLEIDPEDTALRLMVGWIRLQRGTTEDLLIARGLFRSILRDDEDYRARLGLGESLERLGLAYRESAELARAGERRGDPDDLQGKADEHLAEAVDAYREILETRPDNLKALNGLQRVASLRGEWSEALRWAERLLDISRAELGAWRRQLERPNLTVEEERRLREREAASTSLQLESHLNAAFLLTRLDREPEALPHLDRALELAPERAEIYSRRAQLLGELGDLRRAVSDIDAFLRLSDAPYEDPDIQRAFEMKRTWESALASAGRAEAG